MVITDRINPGETRCIVVDEQCVGRRLDQCVSEIFTSYTRSFFKNLIDSEHITVNDVPAKAGYKVRLGDTICITLPKLSDAKMSLAAFEEQFKITVVASEPDFLIVSKPAGLMVHKPNEFSTDITLVDWLLSCYAELKHVGTQDRPGIIHRLDKNTSGLLIIPRTQESFGLFGELFRTRKIDKIYWVIVKGHPNQSGTIDLPIGRDPVHKHRMIHLPKSGIKRDAFTSYRVLKYFKYYTLIEVKIMTGRTHQIRVHCAAIGHPVIGDTVYGEPSLLINRQAMHAKQIAFIFKNKAYSFDSDIPADMQKLLTT